MSLQNEATVSSYCSMMQSFDISSNDIIMIVHHMTTPVTFVVRAHSNFQYAHNSILGPHNDITGQFPSNPQPHDIIAWSTDGHNHRLLNDTAGQVTWNGQSG